MVLKLLTIVRLEIQTRWLRLTTVAIRLGNYRKYRQAFYGLTLNTIGPMYGVQREKGEPNRHYERRILKVAVRRGPTQTKTTSEEEHK